jgi:hypothetical protein
MAVSTGKRSQDDAPKNPHTPLVLERMYCASAVCVSKREEGDREQEKRREG